MKKQLPILPFALLAGGLLNAQSPCDATIYSGGEATYYTLIEQAPSGSRSGHCSFYADNIKPYYGAMYTPLYANSAECGVCLEVSGTAGTKIIEIVDECPDCKKIGDIDLSPTAFQEIIGPLSIGRSNIQWHEVACPWGASPINVTTQSTNQWYAKVTIGKHKNRINKVEIYDPYSSAWVNMNRTADNGWINASLISITGTTNVRITDVFGQILTVSGVEIASGIDKTFQGTSNFTPCLSTDIAEYEMVRHISVYPNPMSDGLVIDDIQGIKTIHLYTILGELIYSESLTGTASRTQIYLPGLAAGTYTIQLSNDKQVVYNSKLIKM